MIQLILLAADTIALFVLIHLIGGILDKQLEYLDEQYKQGWRIQNLENDKYELKGRINALEGELSETQSKCTEYIDKLYKQRCKILDLECNKYRLDYRVRNLERQVNKNADNDNACD